MSVDVNVDRDEIVIRTGGLDTLLCLAREIRIPRTSIADVQLMATKDAKQSLGWRVGGGYFPGGCATGWFLWKRRRGLKQWWCVYRDDEVLVIDTDQRQPARVVLQLPDRADIARRLSR